jgi:hypothetical protein
LRQPVNLIWRDADIRFDVGREHTRESGRSGIFRGWSVDDMPDSGAGLRAAGVSEANGVKKCSPNVIFLTFGHPQGPVI